MRDLPRLALIFPRMHEHQIRICLRAHVVFSNPLIFRSQSKHTAESTNNNNNNNNRSPFRIHPKTSQTAISPKPMTHHTSNHHLSQVSPTNTESSIHHTCTTATTPMNTSNLPKQFPPVRDLIACLQAFDDALKSHPLEVYQHVVSTPGRSVQRVSVVTPFHSSVPPPIALSAYALRIVHHSGYGADGLALGLALMGRYVKATGEAPTPLTVHRLLAICIVVGMKATCDKFVKNVYMAPIVGVPLAELNNLEVALLKSLAYCAIPDAAELFGVIASLTMMKDASDTSLSSLRDALTGNVKTVSKLSTFPDR
jgi:hypothetical protein